VTWQAAPKPESEAKKRKAKIFLIDFFHLLKKYVAKKNKYYILELMKT